ncbi:MAG TPA: protein-L-isoaspartate O-methyltransferase [Rhodanobacteraceae bacterium]|nr:protein-L-isoaspartate O-methyltransferase [Rhodanobacteraceae bacterium]
MTPNIEQARHNMIDNQVRPWDVLDPRVLDALEYVRREDFVPAAYRNMAFVDLTLPLGHGEVMMKPVVEGRMLQALSLEGHENVLEIGTGSGYLTACLAHLAGHVTSVDMHAEFTRGAQDALTRASIGNATLLTDEAVHAYQPDSAFDVVVVTGAVPSVPERFLAWLKPGGRAFLVVGRSPVMRAVLLHHEGSGKYREESLFETDMPYLVHAAPTPRFTL